MIPVLGGVGAALAWAAATLCSARSTRLLGAPSVLALVMLVGLLVLLPLLAIEGVPSGLGRETLALLAVGGAGNVAGLLLAYAALGRGKVALVAPIVSTEGAVAAVLAVAGGEAISPATGAALGVVVVGVVLASLARDAGRADDGLGTAALAAAAALCFGVSLYATGRVAVDLPVVWALVPARLIGVTVVALSLVLATRLRLTRQALPFVAAAGVLEVIGFASFALGARHGIATSAVLASQFAGFAALGGVVFFGERLGRVQLAGVAAIAAGVATVTALQA